MALVMGTRNNNRLLFPCILVFIILVACGKLVDVLFLWWLRLIKLYFAGIWWSTSTNITNPYNSCMDGWRTAEHNMRVGAEYCTSLPRHRCSASCTVTPGLCNDCCKGSGYVYGKCSFFNRICNCCRGQGEIPRQRAGKGNGSPRVAAGGRTKPARAMMVVAPAAKQQRLPRSAPPRQDSGAASQVWWVCVLWVVLVLRL
jgi:hypothetical protein